MHRIGGWQDDPAFLYPAGYRIPEWKGGYPVIKKAGHLGKYANGFFLTEVNSFLLLEYVFVQWISMEKQI